MQFIKMTQLTRKKIKEHDTLKNDIVARKKQLKAEGLSGRQQDKDELIVKWMTRMTSMKRSQECLIWLAQHLDMPHSLVTIDALAEDLIDHVKAGKATAKKAMKAKAMKKAMKAKAAAPASAMKAMKK